MSRHAVDISVAEVLAWDDKRCRDFVIEARWGSKDSISCPHCGTVTDHRWFLNGRRWMCRACRKYFSVTSGTVFDSHKLRLQEIVAATLMWVNSSAGQPALELKRHSKKSYNTVFVLQHKLREALIRGYNVGLLNGDVEIDGSHQSGRRAMEKRGKPQVTGSYSASTPAETIQAAVETGSRQAAEGAARAPGTKRNPSTRAALPRDRRLVIAIRKRAGGKWRGAVTSRIAIVRVEDEKHTTPVLADFVAKAESVLNSDTESAYTKVGGDFLEHRTVVHSKQLVGPNGENNNLAEELNFRLDRAEQGSYLNIEPKYLFDYAVEVAFRSDTRRISNRAQLKLLLNIALNVGYSRFWRGFTHGKHRDVELLHRDPTAASPSGPVKGRKRAPPR